MNTQPSNNVINLFVAHYHHWQPIDGWRARYRCPDCGAVGYKPRLVTTEVEGGPYGSTRVTPYVCSVKRAGLRCGCPAVKKLRGGWKCRAHAANHSTSHTHEARELRAAAVSTEQRAPRREDQALPPVSA
jgi:hypothetical protein